MAKQKETHTGTNIDGTYRYRLQKARNRYGEYVVMAWKEQEDGTFKRWTDADYFTDDWDDALGTLSAMKNHT